MKWNLTPPTSVICVSPSLHLYTAKYRTLQEFQLANLGLLKSLMPPVLMFSARRAEALPPLVLMFSARGAGSVEVARVDGNGGIFS